MSDRDHTIYTLARCGVTLENAQKAAAALPAIQRAHEAACMGWRPETVAHFERAGDKAFERLKKACEGAEGRGVPLVPVRQRDPRGCTVCLYRIGDNQESCEPYARLGATGFTISEMESIDRAEQLAILASRR